MSDIIKEVMDKNLDIDETDVTDRTDSKPLDNLRSANDMLKDDAPTDCLEVSKKENPADDGTRSPRTAYSDNWASNENPNEVFHKAVKVVSDKAADTMKPDGDLNVILEYCTNGSLLMFLRSRKDDFVRRWDGEEE